MSEEFDVSPHFDYPPWRSPDECKQVFKFTTGIELHKQLACCEMPVSLFLQAVCLAQKEIMMDVGNFENQPSVRLLCDWWDKQNPGRSLPAAFFYFDIRVEDNNIYFSGLAEAGSVYAHRKSISHAQHSARIGDFIILEFFGAYPAFDGDCGYLATSVDGDPIGYDLGWVGHGFPDGAWDTWRSLQDFPEDFPELFHCLSFLANAEAKIA